MPDLDDALTGLRGDERIVEEARHRWRRCKEWQGEADKWWLDDTKFANADTRNGWQWPSKIFTPRDDDGRPCLTLNKTRVHNDIVINEAMQNKASIKIRPTGGSASYEAAQIMQSIVRRIEYISQATVSYRVAITHQIDGGVGYVKLETAYVSERSFDQDIYIRLVRDPLCVYLDPDAREPGATDAGFGFEFERMSREKFNANPKYRKFKNKIGKATLGNDDNWLTEDEIMVAMYHRRKGTADTFVSFLEPESGQRVEKLASEIEEESGPEILAALLDQIKNGEIDGRTREVTNQAVQWFMIAGDVIVDRGDWAGKYIPIIPCTGKVTVIEGKLDRKSHTRALIDANRMLNYNASGAIEFGALQGKAPYVGPARAFEGQEQWKDSNRKNYSFLAYNDIDEEAPEGMQNIPAPQRTEPPQASPLYLQGMQDAERQMMMVSGQFQTQFGEEDQQAASSGKAINAREKQGRLGTYHFTEHQGDMLRALGMQLIDLIPKIYDTERMLHVLGEDGTKRLIKIDPAQPGAVQELKKEGEEAAEIAFNPQVGEYDVLSDPGPNWATQRQEAWNAISIILQQNMELAGIIGDLLFKFGDFPGADEIMERLKKEIQATKPYLFDENADPGMVALQQQLQTQIKINGELMQKLAEMQLKLRGREQRRDIEAANAATLRLEREANALADLDGIIPKDQLKSLVMDALREIRETDIADIQRANERTAELNGGA